MNVFKLIFESTYKEPDVVASPFTFGYIRMERGRNSIGVQQQLHLIGF